MLVPGAEPLVGAWRQRLDPVAVLGVPAHVTVLWPFVAPADLSAASHRELAALLTEESPFRAELTGIGWFDERVVYCRPEPADRFRGLTERILAHWPDHPPYEGAYVDVVPHLTVGQDAELPRLRQAATAVEVGLPVGFDVDAIHLMTGADEPGSWRVEASFPLGG